MNEEIILEAINYYLNGRAFLAWKGDGNTYQDRWVYSWHIRGYAKKNYSIEPSWKEIRRVALKMVASGKIDKKQDNRNNYNAYSLKTREGAETTLNYFIKKSPQHHDLQPSM